MASMPTAPYPKQHHPAHTRAYTCLAKPDSSFPPTSNPKPAPPISLSRKLIQIEAAKIAMKRAAQIISRYMSSKGEGARINLARALQNIGAGEPPGSELREYQEMVKRINGGVPLRGFAREQRESSDKTIAARAKDAVAVAGEEGKIMIDESGNVFSKDGEPISLAKVKQDPLTEAINQLRVDLIREMSEIRNAVRAPQMVRPEDEPFSTATCGESPLAGFRMQAHSMVGHGATGPTKASAPIPEEASPPDTRPLLFSRTTLSRFAEDMAAESSSGESPDPKQQGSTTPPLADARQDRGGGAARGAMPGTRARPSMPRQVYDPCLFCPYLYISPASPLTHYIGIASAAFYS